MIYLLITILSLNNIEFIATAKKCQVINVQLMLLINLICIYLLIK